MRHTYFQPRSVVRTTRNLVLYVDLETILRGTPIPATQGVSKNGLTLIINHG